MRLSPCLLRTLAVSFGLWWGLGLSVCHATSYLVTLNTTPLAKDPIPFEPSSFAFPFEERVGTVSNTVFLTNFHLEPGGGPVRSSVTLTGRNPFLTTFFQE